MPGQTQIVHRLPVTPESQAPPDQNISPSWRFIASPQRFGRLFLLSESLSSQIGSHSVKNLGSISSFPRALCPHSHLRHPEWCQHAQQFCRCWNYLHKYLCHILVPSTTAHLCNMLDNTIWGNESLASWMDTALLRWCNNPVSALQLLKQQRNLKVCIYLMIQYHFL